MTELPPRRAHGTLRSLWAAFLASVSWIGLAACSPNATSVIREAQAAGPATALWAACEPAQAGCEGREAWVPNTPWGQ